METQIITILAIMSAMLIVIMGFIFSIFNKVDKLFKNSDKGKDRSDSH